MSVINPQALAEMNEAQSEAASLSQMTTLSVQQEKRFNYLLAKISAIKMGFLPQEERQKKADAIARELGLPRTEAQRARELEPAEKAFRNYLRNADKTFSEFRVYVSEDTTSGNVYIPAQWASEYQTRLYAFNGLRQAGATIVSDKTGGAKTFVLSDDQNVGERLAENAQSTLVNPTISGQSVPVFRYGSKSVIVSNELIQDSLYDLNSYLQNTFAQRIGKITQTEFTVGASGGPAGVIPSLNVTVTSGNATSVTVAELNALPKSISYAYRNSAVDPCWMFSDGVEAQLKSMLTSTGGALLFPEMAEGKLLGYRYAVNTDMAASLSATAKAIAFGSFQKAVTIREVTPIVKVSKEDRAEYFQTFFSMVHRQNCIVTDVNAAALLQMHS
jgi:HK97 family phage major capsid protein